MNKKEISMLMNLVESYKNDEDVYELVSYVTKSAISYVNAKALIGDIIKVQKWSLGREELKATLKEAKMREDITLRALLGSINSLNRYLKNNDMKVLLETEVIYEVQNFALNLVTYYNKLENK